MKKRLSTHDMEFAIWYLLEHLQNVYMELGNEVMAKAVVKTISELLVGRRRSASGVYRGRDAETRRD